MSRGSRARALVLVAVGAALLVVAFLWLGGDHGAESEPALPGSGSELPERPSASVEPLEQLAEQEGPSSATAERRAVPVAALRGVVVDADGSAPVAGGTVTWSPLPDGLACLDPLAAERDGIRAGTRTTTTDASGRFELAESPEEAAERATVVWVTHETHLAAWKVLAAGEAGAQALRFALEPAPELAAVVVRPGDVPLQGALVRQITRYPPADAEELDAQALRALAAFERDWTTDAEGRTPLAPFGRTLQVVAVHDGRPSCPWFGRQPEEVELRIGAVFVARGTVTAESPDVELAGLEVTLFEGHEHGLVPARRCAVEADGSWGPVRVPLGDGDSIVLGLHGEGVARQSATRPLPAADSEVVVDFVAKRGFTLPVRVVGADAAGLKGAGVQVLWQEGEEWHTADGTTDDGGLARVTGCAPGGLWVRVSCAGHASRTLDAVQLVAPPAEPLEVRLDRAARLIGRVTKDGEPVEDFLLGMWSGDLQNRRSIGFSERADGSFEVDEMPIGRAYVYASTQELPPCDPVEVRVEAGSEQRVELELVEPLVGRGRVVDLLTGAPVSGATVQLHASWGSQIIDPWGLPKPVRPDGTFELAGFAARDNVVVASAPGYALQRDMADGRGRSEVDFGEIALVPAQELRIEVRGPEGADFTSWTARVTHGGRSTEPVPLDASGRVRFEGITAGSVGVRLALRYDALVDTSAMLLAGRPWELEIELPREEEDGLDVEVVEGGDCSGLPDPLTLRTVSLSPGGQMRTEYRRCSLGERTRAPGPFGPDVMLDVIHPRTFEVLGIERVLEPQHVTAPIRIAVGAPLRTLRVVDADGAPVSGASVFLNLLDCASGWYHQATTGPAGTLRFRPPAVERMTASVFHARLGSALDLPFDLGGDLEETIEIQLEEGVHVPLRLLDGAEPLEGVTVRASRTAASASRMNSSPSDASGLCWMGPTRAGTYWAEPTSAGLWRSKQAIELADPSQPLVLQLRRLGSLEIRVTSAEGLPAPGVRLELRSEELGESVAAWVERGLVQSSSAELVTDATGELLLVGLPNGPYTWTAAFAGGTTTTGAASVPPRATGALALQGP